MTTTLTFTQSTTETRPGGEYQIIEDNEHIPAQINVDLTFAQPPNATIDSDFLNGALFDTGAPGNSPIQTLTGNVLTNDGTITSQKSALLTLDVQNIHNDGTINAIDEGNIDINANNVNGTGAMVFIGATVDVQGGIGNGQSIQIGGVQNNPGFVNDSDPGRLDGSVDLVKGAVDLLGLTATSYKYSNEVLTLWNGNSPVQRLDLQIGGPFGLTVGQTSGGVVIGSDIAEGTPLPLHS